MEFYTQFVRWDKKTSPPQYYAKCPLHPDTDASFTVNADTLDWYCHGCARGGGPAQFIMAYYGVTEETARAAYTHYEEYGRSLFPSEDYVQRCYAALKARPSEVAKLNEMGVSTEIIDKFLIGYEDLRYTYPIKSQTGCWVNVRKYAPPHHRERESHSTGERVKKVVAMSKLGKDNRFYPYEAFDENEEDIFIVEGEKDMLAARSYGINAVTGTGGSNIPVHEIGLFAGKNVYIMVDNDATGKKIEIKYHDALQMIGIRAHHIALPQKDFSDFVQAQSGEDFDVLDYEVTDGSWRYTRKNFYVERPRGLSPMDEEDRAPPEQVSLVQSEDVEKLNNDLILENMSVIGTDPKTYTIPCRLVPACKDQNCQKACPVQSGQIHLEIAVKPRQLINFIDAGDTAQHKYLQNMFGCTHIVAEPAAYINAQKILFQESAAFVEGLDDASFEHRYGVYLYSQDRLLPTVKYNFECTRTTEPRSQQNFYVVHKATPVDTTTEEADTDSLDEAIQYFQKSSEKCVTLSELMDLHYNEWLPALNIEGRKDLFMALALTYLSVTEIKWRGGKLKGWLDTMVIGDTRTGKSQMAQRFIKQLQKGSYINGENAKATGVIGGVQRMGDSWIITWGAIPMNDQGLLIIDEASGLTVEDIKDLSATRSSGAVTINKIAKGEARARTRLIWMSNPRSGRNIEEFYWKGYGAFTEFIPVVEDQARYDLVISAAREDVPTLKNYHDDGAQPPVHHWKTLIDFAWKLPYHDIQYSTEVAEYIAHKATRLDEQYGGGPLVVGVAIHEKIIRLTCAFAIMCGSITQGSTLLLQNKHVDLAIELLQLTYDKPSFDYKGFAKEYKKAQLMREENTSHVRSLVKLYPAINILLSSNMFRGNQVREVLGVGVDEASRVISDLLRRGLLKLNGSGAYIPDKLLVEITKQMEV